MQDEEYMREALRIARNAEGRTAPNPLVGAVIVKDGRIVAEGWHRQAGTPHAEVHALRMAGELAHGATLYVTLEPCSLYGRTGPCAKAVIEAGIVRVVMAMKDPNPLVAGRGIVLLKEAGVEVVCGILEKEARELNRVFLHWMVEKRPYVTMKTAMSLDGKIATVTGKSQWITGEAARLRGHHLRDVNDAILVGIGTVLADDPALTTRIADGTGKNPIRIVVDSKARTPLSANVLKGDAETIIAVSSMADAARIAALRAVGATVLQTQGERVDLRDLFEQLAACEITSILLEGGAEMHYSFLEAGLVDEVYAFLAPMFIGGHAAKAAVGGKGFEELQDAVRLEKVTTEMVGDDVLIRARVKK